jgi:hypothetical protein
MKRTRITQRLTARRLLTLLASGMLVAGVLGVSGTALAVHNEGLFELDTNNNAATCAPIAPPCGDANVADNPPGGADDWADVFANTQNGQVVPNSRAFIADPVSSAENSFYTGGGSKDVNEVEGSWQYGTSNDVVPDKDDLAHAFAQAYKTTTNNPDTGKPDTIVYFGVDRYDNNGDAETGFWFFKNKVTLAANGQFSGKHSVGDVLVLADWGGSNPVGAMTVYEWIGGKNPLRLVSDVQTGADCAKVTTTDNFCAVVNRQNVTQPWTFADKSGSTIIRPLELFEAGINVSKIFGEDRCFSSFLASTRSSHSTTAQLKDFAIGGFEQCGASITITPTATNEVGQSHTFTVQVFKTVAGSPAGASGVNPTVTLTTANGAVVSNKVDTCASTGTDSDGKCTVSFTSNKTGTVTGHATATVAFGGATFNVATDGQSPNSGDAVKTFVDLKISIAPTETNEVGQDHTFTVTAKQDKGDGAGFVNVPNGTAVDVTLTDANGADHDTSSDTCADPGTSGGQCTVTFSSDTAGTVTGHASITVTIGGIEVTRETDGVDDNSGNAVKTYVDAYITINPPEATNTVGDNHVVTVHAYKDDGDDNGFVDVPNGTIITVTLTNDATSNYSISQNSCATGTVSGACTVTFTSPTAGTVTAHASVTLTLAGISITRETDGTAPNSGDAIKHFVAGSISWLKHNNAGALLGGATFTVCKTHDYTLPTGPFVDITDVCVDILDNDTNDSDKTSGEFTYAGVSLGRYTVKEKTAPAGWALDPDTVTVELTPGDSDKTISEAFVDTREILKITGFGYTNAPNGTPTAGVVNGTTVFTATLHNYGSATATLSNSSLVVSTSGLTAGTVTCNGTGTGGLTKAITGTIAAGADGPSIALTCTYTGVNDGTQIIADLVVKSTQNGLEREASGSPARIRLTIQAD